MSTDVTAPASDTPETLEALQQRHRKEQRDLVSRVTQKKKQATKKTRKGVNDECERLEQELQARQAEEVRVLNGGGGDEEDNESEPEEEVVQVQIQDLSINGTATSPSSTTPSTPSEPTGPGKKRNRQKERLARRKADQDAAIARAEQEARDAPNPRELEKARFEPVLAEKGLKLHEIRADGHCLYAAVADQLASRSLSLTPRIPLSLADDAPPWKKVRYAAAGWIEGHPGDFEGFLEDPLPEHVEKIRETGEWGGHLELEALARGYAVGIRVVHSDGRVDRIGEDEEGEIWLGYFRHSHGLGEHYNSLRRAEAS